MNFSFCLQAWIWLCRGAVRSTKRSRVCKPSPETPPSLPGVGVGSAPTDTPNLSQALCSQRAASRPGQHFGGVHVPWPELRSFPAHRGSQHGAFEPFAAVPWKQELSWLCHSRVCKNASRKSLQTWLRIPTKQTFLFPLLSSFPWPVQTGRGRRLSCPRPVEDGDFGEGERESTFLAKPLCINSPVQTAFCCRDWRGERLRNKGRTSPHIPHANICHSSRKKIAN